MTTPARYESFLVRIWQAPSPNQPATFSWQGQVEHLQSSRRWTFDSLDVLLEFLHQQADDPEILSWPADE